MLLNKVLENFRRKSQLLLYPFSEVQQLPHISNMRHILEL